MRFYAFDSFEGLPESQGVDREGYRHSGMGPGAFSCNEPQFRRNLEGWGVDLSRVEIVPGWYEATLDGRTRERLPLHKAAIVLVDCDLYESTVPVLEFIRPLLQNGTLVLFDDWFCFHGDPKRGERRAFGEWLQRNPDLEADEFRRFGPYGNSFILRLRGGAQPQM